MVLLLTLVTALFGAAEVSAQAAAGTGSISGTVTDEAGAPVHGVCVGYYDSDGSGLGSVGTGAGGGYSILDLAPDDYRLEFFTCYRAELNLVDEYYDDKLDLASATPVAVVADANTPNIDAVLATGGTLSGQVTNSLGEPAQNVAAIAFNSRGAEVGTGDGDELGNYSIDGLRSDEYRVQIIEGGFDPQYVSEYYDNQPDLHSAEDITVVQGVETPNINFELARRGSISGTVTDGVGSPIDRVNVRLYNSNDDLVTYKGNIALAATAADGTYTLSGVDPGTYRVRFGRNLDVPDGVGPFGYQFYDNKSTLGSAQTVTVAAGTDTPGINATMGAAGSISGTVTSSGNPRANVCITAYDSSGAPLGLEYVVAIDDRTDAAGHYSLTTLPAGSYRLLFLDCPIWNEVRTLKTLAAQFYEGATQLALATPVVVTVGADTSGIDVDMVASGSIAGTVTVPGTQSSSVCVDVFDEAGSSQASIIDPEATRSGAQGAYVIDGLPAGDYRVKFSDCHNIYGADPEFYDNQPDLASATPVAVTAGVVTPGIDATLALDTTAPDTVITSGPSGVIYTDEATFAFKGTPAADTTRVLCRIDSEPFKKCSSPKTFSGLTNGQHTVSFQAEDRVVNRDQTPATRTFTVQEPVEIAKTAKVGKVKVTGPKKVRVGRKATYKVSVKNSGKAAAKAVKLKVNGKGIAAKKHLGKIAAGQTKNLKVKLKPKKKGKVKATFKVTSKNAGKKVVTKKIKVKK